MFDKLIEILFGILTIDAIVIMGTIFGLTELFKQWKKQSKKALSDFQIRLISLGFGLITSIIVLESYPLKMQIVYGLFYSFAAPSIYWILKRYIIKNLSSDLDKTLSGQG